MRKETKLIAIAVALVLVSSTTPQVFAALPQDVIGSPYVEAIEKMTELGVFHGFPDGTFRPDETMTRAQAAKVITYLLGKDSEVEENMSITETMFPDVSTDYWGAAYINLCADMGIYVGFPDGTFRPEEPVTQRQLAVLLLKVLGYTPTWEEVDEKAAEVGLLSWDYDADMAAPRGILAQAVYTATIKVPRADGTYIVDDIFTEESGITTEPIPDKEEPSNGKPSRPPSGNGNGSDDPEPETGSIKVSVIVTELMDFKTYSVTVHSIDIEGGEKWTIVSPDNENKDIGEMFTRGSKAEEIDLFIFDAQGGIIKKFSIEYRDYDNEILE